ncbi:MAG: ric [Mucilaginibacter sp.]|nr:ric [Mucilaginibacter sp.]
MEITDILDVTLIETHLRRGVIFKKFDNLKPGNFFIIHYDHDPKPLYYQLLAEKGQTLYWDYLHSGPKEWKVKITRRKGEREETVGEIVAKDSSKAAVFKQMGINFACEGRKTIREICNKNGLRPEDIAKQLASVKKSTEIPEMNFLDWEVGSLCKFLIELHHQYIKTNTPFIEELSQKVAKINGEKYPGLVRVSEIFSNTLKLLTLNLANEEQILFPSIIALSEAFKKGKNIQEENFKSVIVPISIMQAENKKAYDRIQNIRALTNGYQVPPYSSYSHNLLFKMLKEFEDDLDFHLHLENNILFPKTIKLENIMRTAI